MASLAEAEDHLPGRLALNATERERLAAGAGGGRPGAAAVGGQLPAASTSVAERARPVYEALLARGVIVRSARAFGAPGALRFTVGWPEENERLLASLAEVLAELPEPVSA